MARRCSVLRCAYDLDFHQVALNPHLIHEEKIRLLVLLRHTWVSDSREYVFVEDISPDQIRWEISVFRAEIEHGLPLESSGFRDAVEDKVSSNALSNGLPGMIAIRTPEGWTEAAKDLNAVAKEDWDKEVSR